MKLSMVLLCVGLLQACGSKKDDVSANWGGAGSPVEMDPNASTGSSGSSTADTGTPDPDTGSSPDDTGAAAGGDTTEGDTSGGEESGGDASGGEESGDDGGGGLAALSVTGFTVTECDGSEGSASAEVSYDEIAEHVRVQHDAYLANCCAEFSLTTTASESGEVTVVYDEGDALCDCVCVVNLRYNIVGLPSGDWNVRIPDGLGGSVTVP